MSEENVDMNVFGKMLMEEIKKKMSTHLYAFYSSMSTFDMVVHLYFFNDKELLNRVAKRHIKEYNKGHKMYVTCNMILG